MGTITIYLTGKEGALETGDYQLEYVPVSYNTNYKKLTITIRYLKPNDKFTFEFRKRLENYDGFRTVVFYTYYTRNDNQVLQKIEVYTSKLHDKNPLVVAFQTKGNKSFKYFTYSEIKKHTYTYGIPSPGDFRQYQLDVKLDDENNHRNRLFFSIQDKPQNYSSKTDDKSISGYAIYRCFADDDDKYSNRRMSKDKLFEKETLKESSTIDKLLKDLHEKPFDFINVYYFIESKAILLVEFIADSTKTHFIRKDENGGYWIKEEVNYRGNEDLKRELDKIKSRLSNLSFMLDKNSDDSKFENKIKVTNFSYASLGFTKYIHTPTEAKKANVLYNDISFPITRNDQIVDKLENVQDNTYTKIETYSLHTRITIHLLIKFTLSQGSQEYYFQRLNNQGNKWKQIDYNDFLRSDENIRNKLLEFNYLLQKSLVIEINKIIRYNSGILSNSSNSLRPAITFTVSPEPFSSCGTFSCYKHDLSRYKLNHKDDVVGIRLKYDNNEVKLYNGDPNNGNRQYMYYNKNLDDFYVYFYGQDTRPLMLCYNYKAYSATSKNNFDQFKFSVVIGIYVCPCNNSDTNFTTNLNDIHSKLNELDIYENRDYAVHNYNKNQVKITVKYSTSGCYIKYIHTPAPGNGLGTIKYKNDYIKDSNDSQFITASGKKEVIVYYSSSDSGRNNPLLVTLCDKINCSNSSLYYELQKNGSQTKLYKKVAQSIKLDTNPNGTLYKTLDSIFYTFTKSLCIVLDKHNSTYESKLTSNRQPGQHSRTNIQVEDFTCKKLHHSGYKCYIHKITNIAEINEVGGLKFNLYDSKELNLYSGSDGSEKMTDIKYTRCKGNVLVYFYESDPRPLLLCFDSKGYKPRDTTSYEKDWVLVESIKNCDCSSSDFDAEKTLQTLYRVSMELNPVKLDQTKTVHNEQGLQNGHSYTIHNYSPRPIKIKITSENLVCYKKYVHQHENGSNTGYRLGKIEYEGLTKYGLSYPEHRPLQKVSLYYSVYDTQHNYPLLVELGFKLSSFEDSEYHKLDDKKTLKWDSLSSDKYKYLLEKFSKKETFENGLYDIRTGLSIAYDKDQKKQYFFDPEKCTEDNVDIPAIAGGTVGAAAVIGTGITIGVVVAKKLVIVTATTAAVA